MYEHLVWGSARWVMVLAVVAGFGGTLEAQQGLNPYRPVAWGELPEGRELGPTGAVYPDVDGRHIWVADRCGPTDSPFNTGESCLDKKISPILLFSPEGKLVRSFGEGLFLRPHGLHVDWEGNVWVADAPSGGLSDEGSRRGIGHQVIKFSPEGEVLMTLGEAGGADEPGYFFQPNDIVVAPSGDIFIAEGHETQRGPARIVKFDSKGELLMAWGSFGSGQGEFVTPHALAMDSQGRLFVADRGNNRIQVFDQEGEFLAVWTQFGSPSGLYIDADDVIYVADASSGPTSNPGWEQGIRIGDARTGWVTAFIPAQQPPGEPGGAEGVAADAEGNVYGAETRTATDVRRSQPLQKYVRIRP